jgi:hypothetical protein
VVTGEGATRLLLLLCKLKITFVSPTTHPHCFDKTVVANCITNE